MTKFNLQLFTEAVPGNRIVYLYRVHSEEATTDGACLAFVTEDSRSLRVDSDTTETKDGSIVTPGTMEHEHEVTSILAKDDEMIEKLENACANRSLMDLWEANLDKPAQTAQHYKGKYFQAYITELEITSNAEDLAEVNMTFAINGAGASGDVKVSDRDASAASYTFKDTPKTGG